MIPEMQKLEKPLRQLTFSTSDAEDAVVRYGFIEQTPQQMQSSPLLDEFEEVVFASEVGLDKADVWVLFSSLVRSLSEW